MNNVYVICPAHVVTGGVELLHQLAYKLNLLGINAYIYYINPSNVKASVPAVYLKYNVRIAEEIDDKSDNLIIFPEVYIPYIKSIKNAKCVLWWLSVDNAVGSKEDFDYVLNNKELIHFSQSEYSTQMLLSHQIPNERIYWLCDYINSEFLHLNNNSDKEKVREDVVLFNPKKGFQKTASIISKSNGFIKWQALAGFTPAQMRKVLSNAKVYIDFGNHPGRDRIPREATMCGCCLITNRMGSAANKIDVAIDEKYKFDVDASDEEILETIYKLISNYDNEKEEYAEYCHRSAEEFKSFETDLLSIFENYFTIFEKKYTESELLNIIENHIENEEYNMAYPFIIKYRLEKYTENTHFTKLEADVRIALGEYHEAEYIVKEGLKNAPNDYDLMLLWAKALLKMNCVEDFMQCIEKCRSAMNMSKGTEDENRVVMTAMSYIEIINNFISEANTKQ